MIKYSKRIIFLILLILLIATLTNSAEQKIKRYQGMFGDKAIAEFNKIKSEADKGNIEILLKAGVLANNIALSINIKNPDKYVDLADDYLEKYLDKKPKNNEAILYSGNVYTLIAKYSSNPIKRLIKANSGIKLIDKAIKNEPNNPIFRLVRLGNSVQVPGFFKRMPIAKKDVKFFEKIIINKYAKYKKYDNFLASVYLYVGDYYVKIKNFKKAKKYYTNIIKKFSKSYEAIRARKKLDKIK